MAKRKVNKSEAIRNFVSENRTASAKEVAEALKKKGIVVTTAMIANVKSKAGLTRSRRGRPRKVTGSQTVGRGAAAKGDVALDTLIEAKRLVAKAGSAQRAVEVIRALEKLESIAG